MSNRRRKLSFLGFAPQMAGTDELQLDEEMERVVWSEADASAQPPPYSSLPGSAQEETAAGATTRAPQMAEGGAEESAGAEERHVQFEPPQDAARILHGAQARKYSLQEGARGGGEGGAAGGVGGGAGGGGRRRVSIPPGDEPLSEGELDDQPTPLYHNWGSAVHLNRKDGEPAPGAPPEGVKKKPLDRSPHSVFVQLDELLAVSEGTAEWQERARWIKYEEDVEEGADRWGRPHVASLSFHSLLNLRRCLETGVVLLDLDEKDLPGVAYRVVEGMANEQLIAPDDQGVVLRSLLMRHRHVQDERFRFSISGRKHSSYTSLQSLWAEEEAKRSCTMCDPDVITVSSKKCRQHTEHPRTSSVGDGRRRRSSYALPMDRNLISTGTISLLELERLATLPPTAADEASRHDIMRRIPGDAEATTVLVGAVGFLAQPTIAFVRLAQGILMPSITEVPVPVRFMFILLGPSTAELDYHEVGRSISTLMSNPTFHGIAYRADDRRELLSGINEFLDDSIVLPPGDWEGQELLPVGELRAKSRMIRRRKQSAIERKRAASDAPAPLLDEKKALLEAEKGGTPPKEPDDPLSRTGRLFGGVVRDMRRRYPFYLSDFSDALNGQCAATAIFMYFAALSSAITFGGLLAEKTHSQIGISETLVFTCVGGIAFALVSGQPMMITGATGPLLLLDESLASFCRSAGLDFLVARMYAGLWMIVIALCVAAVEGSVAVRKITRFTEDIFAFLISLIFISEPVTAIISLYRAHPLLPLSDEYCENPTDYNITDTFNTTSSAVPAAVTPRPNTALFCTMLTLLTFVIAYYLRIFRNGKFLGRSARRALGDFGVPIAIVLMVGLSCVVPVWTETLRVPAGLSPTLPRSWLVPLNPGLDTVPPLAAVAMALPALMVYIIVFMETHIAELIVDKPERGLKKGSGFHMDVVVMSLINAVCGMCGAPWQCVATVRSVSHVAALTVMSTTHAPGDKPHIVEVKEQRLTGLVVATLVGASVVASQWLRLVPMAVLFGVFLYMGVSALGGIQFWDRCILLLKPVKHHPQVPYVRRVPTLKMHMYTLIQATGLCVLYWVKSSPASLALPLFLVLMVPLRMSLVWLFTPLQLRALDGAQQDIEKDDEPDFYEEAPLP